MDKKIQYNIPMPDLFSATCTATSFL